MRSKVEARRKAHALEDEHRLIRDGLAPVPESAHKHQTRPIEEVMSEYLDWGKAQGGRGGRPWGKDHVRNKRTRLFWWATELGFETLGDITGSLPRVEKATREMLQTKAPKTVANYSEALSAFCDWCRKRGLISGRPLDGLAPFDTTPQTNRRAMTADEVRHFLEHCDIARYLFYQTAFMSGLRANELRSLDVEHLDVERGGLRLDAAWTKNRKAGFQPLPKELVADLYEYAQSDEVEQLYARHYGRKDATQDSTLPRRPLFYVSSHPARAVDKDLEAAGIPKWTPQGKLDFHAIRKAFINLVIESGVTVKEAQTLARHASPELTMNVYGVARDDRLAEAVERVAEAIKTTERVPREYRQAVGAETKSATSDKTEGCASQKWWRRRESNQSPFGVEHCTNLASALRCSAFRGFTDGHPCRRIAGRLQFRA